MALFRQTLKCQHYYDSVQSRTVGLMSYPCGAEKRADRGPRKEGPGAYAVVHEESRRPRTKGCDAYRHCTRRLL